MSDLTLFDVRNSDPDTARAAAAQIITTKNRDCMLVLAALVERGAATAYELWGDLNSGPRRWKENVVSKRCSSLRDNRYIRDTGVRRPGSSSRELIVWTATELGRRTAQNDSAGL